MTNHRKVGQWNSATTLWGRPDTGDDSCHRLDDTRTRSALALTGILLSALAAAAAVNYFLARKAERRNPPSGQFITIEGVRLHYIERGKGTPVVMLHGNSSMIQDFECSGLLSEAADKFRVIVFDRPGYGYSARPRRGIWTPAAQARLIEGALAKMGVSSAIFLGHSWGTLVALAIAKDYRRRVRALVLISGYFYADFRPSVLIPSLTAIPLLGDIWCHTGAPFVSRILWPNILRKLFSPNSVPEKFRGFPRELALRPGAIRAGAVETALLIPCSRSLEESYDSLDMPIEIVTGGEDRIVDGAQSEMLYHAVRGSALKKIEGAGHMVHQVATAEIILAMERAAERSN
jgi:pimeloyl-ACP methyl ester carboxylesterase